MNGCFYREEKEKEVEEKRKKGHLKNNSFVPMFIKILLLHLQAGERSKSLTL